jgi:hypothetical protein
VKLGRDAHDTCAVLSESCGGETVKKSSVFEWHKWFKESFHVKIVKTMLIMFFNIKSTVHFEIHSTRPNSQLSLLCGNMEGVTWLHEAVHEKDLNFGLMMGFFSLQGTPYQAVSGKKSVTEMERMPFSPELALNDFCLFLKMKSALKGRRFWNTEDKKKMTMILEDIPQQKFQKCFQQ